VKKVIQMECCTCSREKKPSGNTCIAKVPIFSSLTAQEMLEIALITTHREYRKGETIYLAGEKGERLFVIHQGKVKISKLSEAGKEQVLRVLGAGDFMGELSLFIRSPLDSNAEALEPTTVCIIDGYELNRIISKRPGIAVKIIEELSKRLQSTEHLLESLSLRDVEQRVATTLLKMANNNSEIVLSMSKKDLASHIGMSQETLSRKLSLFQDMGWIKLIGQRKILILDLNSLSEVVNT
jgi:CRP-like cAMP-binding protein